MPVRVQKGDITKVKGIDVIVSAANGIGVCGAGVAGAIRRAAGEGYARHVREVAMSRSGGYAEGEVYATDCGLLGKNGVQIVLHAVTMKYPGGFTSYHIVDQCLEKTLKKVSELGYKSVAIPGLGTGIGGLDAEIVARRIVRLAQKYADLIDVLVIDIDPEFTAAAHTAL